MEGYVELCERVRNIIINKGYVLQMEYNNGIYNFNIYDNNNVICNLQISNTVGNILVGKTRSRYQNKMEDHNIFKISWVYTQPNYRGNKLALLLIIYSICYLKIQYPNINYVTLDDDSDNSIYIKNIYNSVGFNFQEPIEMDLLKSNRLQISGPEKQLLIDNVFLINIHAMLNTKHSRKKTLKPKTLKPKTLKPKTLKPKTLRKNKNIEKKQKH
jgi:hypothetical protein